MKYFLVFWLISSSAWALSPRELALKQFPLELRALLGASPEQAKLELNSLKVLNKMEDKETIFLNVYGVNYDVTLGKKGREIVWMARQAIKDKTLYRELSKILSTEEKRLWKKDELDLPKHGVLFRFKANHDPLSIVVKKLP